MSHAIVPVKIGVLEVGVAKLEDDGRIVMQLGPNQGGAELIHLVQVGMLKGLSIRPIIDPALNPISEPSHENARPLSEYEGFKFNRPGNDHIY